MPVFNHVLADRADLPEDAIWIMRPGRWGNPFIIGRDGDRATVLERHRTWLWEEIAGGRIALEDLAALDGKGLVCCCSPQRCHGETLLAAAAWASAELARRRGNT